MRGADGRQNVCRSTDRDTFDCVYQPSIVQIVGYDRTPEPALVIASSGSIQRVSLDVGVRIDYGLEERTCAGRIHNAVHQPCTQETAPWCDAHAETWVCARCRGTCLKDEMDCFVEHVVYLAIVAPDSVKVGVTKANRFERRMHEQGADRGAIIRSTANGRIAREIEASIAQDLPDRIDTHKKISGLQQNIDEDVWDHLVSEYATTRVHEPSYAFTVDDQPIPETLATGEVCGTKGRLLVLQRGDSTYVSDMRELVGYQVQRGAERRSLQSGLGSFG